MLHRSLRYAAGWEWHQLLQSGEDNPLQELKRVIPECTGWLNECKERNHNHIEVYELPAGQSVLLGTLMFQVTEKAGDLQPLHFRMTTDRLVTIHSDMSLPIRLQRSPWEDKLNGCPSAPEAFLVILRAILEPLYGRLEAFESRIPELESAVRNRNRNGLIDLIFDCRFDLLHSGNQFIHVTQIKNAAKEAYIGKPGNNDSYERLANKLMRIEKLIQHYSREIDNLVSLDDMVSGLQGADARKILPLFAFLLASATVTGALWGVYYERFAWLQKPLGIAVLGGLILSFTAAIYVWLGNIGGSLTGKRRKSKKTHAKKRRYNRSSLADKPASTGKETHSRMLSRRQKASASLPKTDDTASR